MTVKKVTILGPHEVPEVACDFRDCDSVYVLAGDIEDGKRAIFALGWLQMEVTSTRLMSDPEPEFISVLGMPIMAPEPNQAIVRVKHFCQLSCAIDWLIEQKPAVIDSGLIDG